MRLLSRTSLTSLASVLLLAIAPACSDEIVDDDEVDVAVDDGNDRGAALEDDADDELGGAAELDQMAMAAGEVSAALVREGEAAMKTLQMASDPAHVYIRQQVEMHEAARVIVDGVIEHFDAGEFRELLEDTHATIVAHREHAIEILRGFQ